MVAQTRSRNSRTLASSPATKTIKKAAKVKKVGIKKTKLKATKVGLDKNVEENLMNKGFKRICGVDEAGRGPLAGPVVAACCIVPKHVYIHGIDDSKKVKLEDRERIFKELTTHPDIEYGISIISEKKIDEINILQASMKAMSDAVDSLQEKPDYILVDGPRLPDFTDTSIDTKTVVKGDSKVYSIAAASVIAKVTRDRIMEEYHKEFPQYNFGQHKGYGTAGHMAALREHGPCRIHRYSYRPVQLSDPNYKEPENEPKGKKKKAAATPKKKTAATPKKKTAAATKKKTAAATKKRAAVAIQTKAAKTATKRKKATKMAPSKK